MVYERTAMNLKGKNIVLRAIESSDLQFLKDMINDPEIEKMVVGWSFPISSQDQENWYAHQKVNENIVRLIVELDKKPVGLVSLNNIDWKNRKATTAIKLHSTCPKRMGVGTDALNVLLHYAFEELNLNRLEAAWIVYNQASENLHLKCGWKIEGVQRKAIFKNGEYHDLKIAGIMKNEYLSTIGASIIVDNLN